MKKYKEGVDFEWVKTKGSNAKSKKFFTAAEKKARESATKKAEAKPKVSPRKATRKSASYEAVDVQDTTRRGAVGGSKRPKSRPSGGSAIDMHSVPTKSKPKSKRSLAKMAGLDIKPVRGKKEKGKVVGRAGGKTIEFFPVRTTAGSKSRKKSRNN